LVLLLLQVVGSVLDKANSGFYSFIKIFFNCSNLPNQFLIMSINFLILFTIKIEKYALVTLSVIFLLTIFAFLNPLRKWICLCFSILFTHQAPLSVFAIAFHVHNLVVTRWNYRNQKVKHYYKARKLSCKPYDPH